MCIYTHAHKHVHLVILMLLVATYCGYCTVQVLCMRESVQGARSDRDSDRERGVTERQEDGVTERQGKEEREGSREGASERASARAQEKENAHIFVRAQDCQSQEQRQRHRNRQRQRQKQRQKRGHAFDNSHLATWQPGVRYLRGLATSAAALRWSGGRRNGPRHSHCPRQSCRQKSSTTGKRVVNPAASKSWWDHPPACGRPTCASAHPGRHCKVRCAPEGCTQHPIPGSSALFDELVVKKDE